jgi:uncharacterized protein YjbI with pentapeptide repeats
LPEVLATSCEGASLIQANLAGAMLTRADLTRATLSGANLLEADLSRANLTGAELFRANLTRARLANANLTDANLTKVDLTHTFLNRRTRFDRANLTEAVLTGKDLTGFDLAGATLTNATLTSTNLTNAKLAGVKLDRADLTGANLTGADLTGAHLTRADLLRADLRDTPLTQVVWKDTNCPYGGKTCEGCSNVSPPSEPPASWLQEASADKSKWQWYQFNGTSAVPDENLTPMLLGTSGAPLQNVNFKPRGYANDGVQGGIYNDTDQRIVVRSGVAMTADERDFSYYANVILDPGGSVPYQFSGEIYDDDEEGQAQGAIEILRYDNGRATGDRAKLWLADYPILQPATEFTPPGHEDPLPQRENWEEDDEHSEIWGSFRMDVKRERDGYRVQGSETFNRYYRDPNDKNTGDWAIFTIRIKSL